MDVDDILSSIFSYLLLPDRFSVRLVNKRWKRLSTDTMIDNMKIYHGNIPFARIRRLTISSELVMEGILSDRPAKYIEELSIDYSGGIPFVINRAFPYMYHYVSHLTSLRYINIPSNTGDISMLTCLTGLQLYGTKYIDLKNLANLRMLRCMESEYNCVIPIIERRYLTQLESLHIPYISMNVVGDCITNLINLTQLTINDVNPYHLTALHLRSLECRVTNGEDFSVLPTLWNLTIHCGYIGSIPFSLTSLKYRDAEILYRS